MPWTGEPARPSNTVDSRAMPAVAAVRVLSAANCSKEDASITLDYSMGTANPSPPRLSIGRRLGAHSDLDTPERAKVDPDAIARSDRRRHDARAGRHDFAGAQRQAEARELVHQPGQRDARVAEYVAALSGARLAIRDGADHPMLDQVHPP